MLLTIGQSFNYDKIYNLLIPKLIIRFLPHPQRLSKLFFFSKV